MSEGDELQIDALKSHLRAIIDQARRAGPEACRRAHYEAKTRLSDELGRLALDGHPDCNGLHVLAAVAFAIYQEASATSDPNALDWLLESISMDMAADRCEQAHAPPP
jgi:hypothetical protein